MATPDPLVFALPMGSAPSRKFTTRPEPGFGVTVAVSVTLEPAHAGLLFEVSRTVCPRILALKPKRNIKQLKTIFLARDNIELTFSILIPGKNTPCTKLFIRVTRRGELREYLRISNVWQRRINSSD